jgi:group I intron endonuclease
MNINILNTEDLLKCGVYKITNKTTNRCYIGSTIMTFIKRINHHINRLNCDKHKNNYLQNAWNKYGENNFIVEIVEITNKTNTLDREQYWLDWYKENDLLLYNINPLASGTPNLSKETILKRAATMKRKYASGELKSQLLGKEPWNKGLTKNDIDYSFLKVKKKITSELLNSRNNRKERLRNEIFPEIYVYDLLFNFLGKWRSAKDLEEFSLKENNLPIKSRFNTERMGKPINFLQSVNINKSCTYNKPYKGLYFSYKPLHQVIDVEKSDKLLENPEEDNQQPI